MTNTTKPIIRKMLAGMTLAGALTLPLAGVAAASDGPGGHSTVASGPRGSGVTGVHAGDRAGATAPTTVATIDTVRARCAGEITRRLADLDRLAAKVAQHGEALTTAHVTAINAIIGAAKAGLTTRQTDVAAATTLDALRPLCEGVITDFRIYALVIPQVNLVIATDTLAGKQARFDAMHKKLADAIAAGKTPATEAELATLLADFDARVAAALADAGKVADAVLLLTPAGYNANHNVLAPFVGFVKDARNEARGASKAAHKILDILEGDEHHHGDDAPATTTVAPSPTTTAAAPAT